MTERAIRILVIDDHPMFREGVSRSLSEQPDMNVCGEGASSEEAIRLDRELKPEVILLDLSMPGGGVHALRLILEQSPDVRIVVLTASEADEDVLMALRSGAIGYVLKGVPAATLIEVVRGAIMGESYVSPALAARILAELRTVAPVIAGREKSDSTQDILASLTRREEEILKLVAAGNSNKEVARRLDLQEKTIKHHMTRILQKLNVRNRTEAAMLLRDASHPS
ncbi:response regulator [Pararhizobium antarcticum]|uniref:Two-component system response regulator n=1 Tax=Pararhizobium antarcticum TaxID=1798805 RepID=A0A657LV80_9HYPH|nr:response regulator transcription factor [Pararhizobium antarcticum]OJF97237.1 two-component system response regulator [Rhizobium sp. 58]OJF99092.1 two-component system response regulator [Pararhizobium antarcticum]